MVEDCESGMSIRPLASERTSQVLMVGSLVVLLLVFLMLLEGGGSKTAGIDLRLVEGISISWSLREAELNNVESIDWEPLSW